MLNTKIFYNLRNKSDDILIEIFGSFEEAKAQSTKETKITRGSISCTSFDSFVRESIAAINGMLKDNKKSLEEVKELTDIRLVNFKTFSYVFFLVRSKEFQDFYLKIFGIEVQLG